MSSGGGRGEETSNTLGAGLDAELVGGVNEALGDEEVHDEAVHVLLADLDVAELPLPLVAGHHLLRGRHGGRRVDGVQVAQDDAGEEHQMGAKGRGGSDCWADQAVDIRSGRGGARVSPQGRAQPEDGLDFG